MKYLLDKDPAYSCLYEEEINFSSANSYVSRVEEATAVVMDLQTSYLTEKRDFYAVYTSPYSGGFDLLDTISVPRACAANNINMTQMDYFYGQRTKTYDLSDYNYDKYIQLMDDETEFVFQNGTSTALFAKEMAI